MRQKQIQGSAVLAVLVFAISSMGCSIQQEMILGVVEGSDIELTVGQFPASVLPLEGGVVMNLDISIGLGALLFGNIGGDVAVDDVLFSTEPFDFLGQAFLNTQEVCIVTQEGTTGGGTFDANIYSETASFNVVLDTIALLGNPALASVLPGGGVAFPFVMDATVSMTLADMLGMLTGGGSLEVSQELDTDVLLNVLGTEMPGHLGGAITLAGVDAFPTSPLLDSCIAFLDE